MSSHSISSQAMQEQYQLFSIDQKVYRFGEQVLDDLKERFAKIDQIAEFNQLKVLNAMQKNQVNATHFATSTGYGYNDNGRDNGGIDIRQTFDMGSDKQSADQCRESASDGSFPGFFRRNTGK